MPTLAQCARLAVAFGGGGLATYAIRESASNEYTDTADLHTNVILASPQWAGTTAAVVAVAAVAMIQRRQSPPGAVIAAIAGTLILAAPKVLSMANTPSVTVNAIGAGLLLAAASFPAIGHRDRLISLVLGITMAMMFFGTIGTWMAPTERWMDALPGDPFTVSLPLPLPLLLVIAIVLALAAITTSPSSVGVHTRAVAVGMALPAVYLVLYATLSSRGSGTVSWTVGVGLATAITLTAAWWLGPIGRLFLAGLAGAAATVNTLYMAGTAWWLVSALAVLLGIAAGRRYPRAMVVCGVVLMTLCTATALLPEVVTEIFYVAVQPAAVALTVTAILSTGPIYPAATISAATIPVSMTFFAVSAPREAINYARETMEPAAQVIVVDSPLMSGVVVATIVAALSSITLLLLQRRHRAVLAQR
ncbi:MAG: hypothetical protein GX542_13005 [Rhodococcus sp.]|nr:hypothetical protein [Rhodococcus sp. (in: high G+C Gram-positive bacteria)]